MKFDLKKTILCSLVFGWISLFWGSYDAIMQSINYSVFGLNSFYHGLILSLDNVVALFLLPLFGKFSDLSRSVYGKRKPFIVAGTVLSMIGMAGVFTFATLGKDYFIPYMVFLVIMLSSMAIYRSPGLAIVPDINPDIYRSKANAVSNIVSVIFTVVAMLFFFYFMRFEGYIAIGVALFATTFIMLMVFCFTVKENSFISSMKKDMAFHRIEKEKEDALIKQNNELVDVSEENNTSSISKKYAYSKMHALDVVGFKEDTLLHLPSFDSALQHETSKNKRMSVSKIGSPNDNYNKICILVVVFCFYMAYNALTSNFIKYAEFILGFKQNDAMIPLIVAQIAAILAFPFAAWASSKIGRKPIIVIGFVLMIIAFTFTYFFTEPTPAIYLVFLVLGASFGIVMVNIYPFFLELSPNESLGVNTGYFSVSMTLAMVITPILSGILIDNTSSWFGGGTHDGFKILFPYSIFFLILACIVSLFIKNKKSDNNNNKNLVL